MSVPLIIDLWGDVVCPFCYLGTHQLHLALERFEHREHIIIRHHAFELDPGTSRDEQRTLDEVLAAKYSMPLERARTLNRRVEDDAAALGMTWSLANARVTNTFDAHRVIALALDQERGEAMVERLYRAYFSEGELVSDHATLIRLAREVGVRGAEHLFTTDDFAQRVRADEAAAQELGISGVPAFVIDQKFMVVGAQGADQLVSVLERAWTRRGV